MRIAGRLTFVVGIPYLRMQKSSQHGQEKIRQHAPASEARRQRGEESGSGLDERRTARDPRDD
jgi:hypothetical protein